MTAAVMLVLGTSPSETVHINSGTANTGLFIESTDANSNLIFRDSGSTANIALGCVGDDFRIQNNNSESMRIDSSGNLLVGTTDNNVGNNSGSSNSGFNITSSGEIKVASASGSVFNRLAADGSMIDFKKDGAPVGSIGVNTDRVYLATTSKGVCIDQSAARMIPTDASGDTNDANMDLGQSNGRWKDLYLSNGVVGNSNSITISTDNGTTDHVTVDTSGNLLVGTTDTDPANNNVNGTAIGAANYFSMTRTNGAPMILNRKSSDGDIALFRKDGAPVGSIGAEGGDLHIGTGGTHLRFRDADSTIVPHDGSAVDDDAISLGRSNVRFKDLYLSGGVYLGGTGSANKLDDYEEGTWTPTYTSAGSNAITVTYDIRVGRYVKVGNMVKVTFRLRTDAVTGGSGDALRVTGLPFSSANISSMHYGAAIGRRNGWGNKPATAYVQTNSTYLLMIRDGSEASGTLTTTNDMATGANDNDLDITVIYQTA